MYDEKGLDDRANENALEKVRRLIKDIDIGMLTTRSEYSGFRSRPMSSNGDVSADGTIYFFTRNDARLVDEILSFPEVHVSFANPKDQCYVSLAGRAEVVSDKDIMRRHWKPQLRAWFPDGIEGPEVSLIRVHMLEAEYWDAAGNFLSHTLSFAKAALTGKPAEVAEHGVARTHV